MDFFDQRYFKIDKFFMSCIGQWPYQPMYQKIIISIYCNFTIVSMTIGMIGGLWTSKEFDETIKLITAIIISAMSFSTMNNFIINAKQCKLLLDELKLDWMEVSEPEVEILKKSADTGRLLSLAYKVYIYVCLMVYIVGSYVPQILDFIKPLNETRSRRRTYQSNYYYLDPEKYYILITLHENAGSTINISLLTIIDSMFALYTQHICGMFGVLRYRIENILKNNNGSWEKLKDFSKENEKIKKETIACISLHQKNIDYAKRLDSTFTTSIFFQIGLGMVLLSVTGYVAIAKKGAHDEFMQFFLYAVCLIIHTFYNCLSAQKLIDASENIVTSVYTAEWYKMPIETQNLLKIVILRSSRPCELQAGGVFILSVKTFSSCIQKSFSYLTVLLSVQK